jgi:drug/metabolite transporter (DMT)-like permease
MLYLLGVVTALQIIIAQSLWKIGLKKLDVPFDQDFIFSSHLLKFVFSFYILLGIIIYILATLTYLLLLSKYKYSSAQTVVVVTSLIFTFLSATIVFSERFKAINLVGVACLLLGVFLITKF